MGRRHHRRPNLLRDFSCAASAGHISDRDSYRERPPLQSWVRRLSSGLDERPENPSRRFRRGIAQLRAFRGMSVAFGSKAPPSEASAATSRRSSSSVRVPRSSHSLQPHVDRRRRSPVGACLQDS
jgi:hypothetical protein